MAPVARTSRRPGSLPLSRRRYEATCGALAGHAPAPSVPGTDRDLNSGPLARQTKCSRPSIRARSVDGTAGSASKFGAMARSPFEIELRSQPARYTVPHGEALRAKIVLLAAEGKTNAEIARRLDCAVRTVSLWRRRFFEERLDGLRDRQRPGRPRRFPPEEVAQVKAIACELPLQHGLPLSRFSRAELHRLVVERGVSEASASTIARWLREDALKPWQHRSWSSSPTRPSWSGQGPCSTSTKDDGRAGCCTRASS